MLSKRFKRINKLSINMNAWGYMYTLSQYLVPLNSIVENITEFIFLANNVSLNPSISNSSVKNIALLTKGMKSL